jgi:hypothetical protein
MPKDSYDPKGTRPVKTSCFERSGVAPVSCRNKWVDKSLIELLLIYHEEHEEHEGHEDWIKKF